MHDMLQKIMAQKQKEVELMKCNADNFFVNNQTRKIKSLKQALLPGRAVIAEIKRASPAKGLLADIPDPVLLAKQYQQAGAAAVSVLTDVTFFQGSVQDLAQVSNALQETSCAVLRKEFIIDPIQIRGAVQWGADAVLLIVAVLQERTQALLDEAHRLGLEVLLEVHTKEELAMALDTDADIIGINNRNLHTLHVDVQTSLDLIQHIPDDKIVVSESGIHDAHTANRLYDMGFDGLLVGEALVTSDNPAMLISAFRGVT